MENLLEKIVALVLVINMVAYTIKIVLKSKGYPIDWLFNYSRDIKYFWKLIKETTKFVEKFLYFNLLTSYFIIIVLFIIAAFLQILTFLN